MKTKWTSRLVEPRIWRDVFDFVWVNETKLCAVFGFVIQIIRSHALVLVLCKQANWAHVNSFKLAVGTFLFTSSSSLSRFLTLKLSSVWNMLAVYWIWISVVKCQSMREHWVVAVKKWSRHVEECKVIWGFCELWKELELPVNSLQFLKGTHLIYLAAKRVFVNFFRMLCKWRWSS